MKITCNSCGAKYTIADEKVVGRRVKVRCKSCKASILVDGTGGAEGAGGEIESEEDAGDSMVATGPATAAAAGPTAIGKKPPERKTAKKNTWSVNLSDDDSREMTTDELVQGWKDGTVSQDAYVWKDGMDDWKPILEVPELKLRLKAVPAKAKSEEGLVTSSKRGAAAPAGSSDDLFGGVEFAGGGESDASAGALLAGGAHDDEKKAPTGQRNESSVLFSLDALRTHEPAAKEERTAASDIFGTGPSGGLGGFGGGGLGGGLDLLTAPAKDPPPAPAGARVAVAAAPLPAQKGKGGLIAAVVVGALVLGGGAFALLGGKGDDAAAEAAKTAAAEAAAKAAAEADAAKKGVEDQLRKAEAEKKAMEEKLKAAEAAAEKKDEPKPEEKKDEPVAGTPASPGTPTTPKPTDPKPTDPKPVAPSGGGAFDTGAAKAALSAAAANTASCAQAGGPTGAGKVEITFAPSGRVTSANVVSGPFGGTAVGGCIASTFRRAKVPAFSGAPQTVAKSFTIH